MIDISLKIMLHPRWFKLILSYISAIALVYYLHCVKSLNIEIAILLWLFMGFFVFIIIELGDCIVGVLFGP